MHQRYAVKANLIQEQGFNIIGVRGAKVPAQFMEALFAGG
jgi:hypothetical protein